MIHASLMQVTLSEVDGENSMVNMINPPAEEPLVGWFLQTVNHLIAVFGRDRPTIVDLAQLRQLPAGSLGRTLADTLAEKQLTPFLKGPRRMQLHDTVHILTGYDTDPIGEAEVQAFLLGAKFNPAQIILAIGLLNVIHRQITPFPLLTSAQIRKRLWQAYWRGYRATFDVDTWQPETQWASPLTQVQKQFHL